MTETTTKIVRRLSSAEVIRLSQTIQTHKEELLKLPNNAARAAFLEPIVGFSMTAANFRFVALAVLPGVFERKIAPKALPERVAALERRVMELEALVAEIRSGEVQLPMFSGAGE